MPQTWQQIANELIEHGNETQRRTALDFRAHNNHRDGECIGCDDCARLAYEMERAMADYRMHTQVV